MPNELIYAPSASTDLFTEEAVLGEINNQFAAGNISGSTMRGAIRFPNINVSQGQSINRAGLILRGTFFNSGTWSVRIRGMDADNVNSLDSGNPYGIYSQTTATSTVNTSSPNSGDDIDITGPVQEILNRGGWSSGNAIGIFMENNGSDNDRYYNDTYGSADDTWLSIRVNNPNLTPAPTTVPAPTFPAAYDYGLKIAKPGFDVKTATESQLLFTTRKNYLKILAEGQVNTTAGVVYQIAHGLGYAPQAIGFARVNGYSFQLPRIIGPNGDPVASSLRGELRVNTTHLRFFTSINASVYYYLFLDPLST